MDNNKNKQNDQNKQNKNKQNDQNKNNQDKIFEDKNQY